MGIFSLPSKLKPSRSFDSLSTTNEKENLSGPARTIPKDPDFGATATLKTFYEGKNSAAPHYDWVDTPPKQLSKKVAKSHDRVAIKVFKIKDRSQETLAGKTPLKIHAIEIQSPALVASLKEILKDEGVFLESSETARFQEPFKPLFFSYDKILSLLKNSPDSGVLKSHLKLLMQVLDELFLDTFSKLANLRKSGLISFKLAWTFFPRNCVVFDASKECNRVVTVVDTETVTDKEGNRFEITGKELAFNGEKFEWRNTKLRIKPFTGNKPVRGMNVFPIEFHEDRAAVEKKLRERGEKVLGYQDLRYCEYEGVGLLMDKQGTGVKHNVSGRILVDYFGYHKHHKGLVRKEQNLPPPPGRGPIRGRPPPPPQPYIPPPSNDPFDDHYSYPPPPPPPNFPGVTPGEKEKEGTYVKRLSEEKQKENVEAMMKREGDLMFISPMLEGFSLKSKLWLNFYIDDISPVHWNDDAYNHLVYPEEQKDLVLTFVSNHQRLKDSTTDVIMGKGQGLILLLSGPPGTGKTLTAEAVADKTRRPLYYLQAEDLGINASVLGPKIKSVFEMATEWNAVILLDEADVFMAERSPADIARNELVSIFLRELEYFQGIIFLTTNLYDTVDKAFRSRVNIHLLFNTLPPDARTTLWGKFLARSSGAGSAAASRITELGREEDGAEEEIPAGVLVELGKWELNGREIKNAVKTVRTWCKVKGFEISLERLEAGIRVTAPQARKIEG